jgi:hypothetical protein
LKWNQGFCAYTDTDMKDDLIDSETPPPSLRHKWMQTHMCILSSFSFTLIIIDFETECVHDKVDDSHKSQTWKWLQMNILFACKYHRGILTTSFDR